MLHPRKEGHWPLKYQKKVPATPFSVIHSTHILLWHCWMGLLGDRNTCNSVGRLSKLPRVAGRDPAGWGGEDERLIIGSRQGSWRMRRMGRLHVIRIHKLSVLPPVLIPVGQSSTDMHEEGWSLLSGAEWQEYIADPAVEQSTIKQSLLSPWTPPWNSGCCWSALLLPYHSLFFHFCLWSLHFLPLLYLLFSVMINLSPCSITLMFPFYRRLRSWVFVRVGCQPNPKEKSIKTMAIGIHGEMWTWPLLVVQSPPSAPWLSY